MHLTVIHPFGDYKRGDKIYAPEEIRKLIDRDEPHDNATHVVKTAGPDTEETAA